MSQEPISDGSTPVESGGTFLYVMDPLCGWCYGFSPVVMQLYERYKDVIGFRVVPGGMATGARVEPVSKMADYILQAYKRVEETTGVKFGAPYLDRLREGSTISNSEPPCRALHLFSTLHPDKAVEYTHQLQRAIYLDGYDWNDGETYAHLARLFGLDGKEFVRRWDSEEARYGVQQEFQWVQAAGISGFPCVVVEKREQYYLAAQGYRPMDDVDRVVEKILKS
jgi:putative protein-disulfide isomerase